MLIEIQNMYQRTQHIDVKYFFISDALKENVIRIEYCESDNHLADVLQNL